jgi:hypothetical protein
MVLKGAGWMTPEDIELAPRPGEWVTAEAEMPGERRTTATTDALTWLQREALRQPWVPSVLTGQRLAGISRRHGGQGASAEGDRARGPSGAGSCSAS